MSDRGYDLPPGYREHTPPGYRTQRQPVDTSYSAQSRQPPQYPAPSSQPAMRSPPRKPIAAYGRSLETSNDSTPPPPPPHRQRETSSPSRYRPRNPPAQSAAGVTGFAGATSFDQPHQGGAQALRDVDNLYGGRTDSPSPEYDSQPSYSAYDSRPSMIHQHTNSQSSVAPLASNAAQRPVNYASSHHSSQRGPPVADMDVGYGYGHDQNMPGERSYRPDGYDSWVDPNDIADDEGDPFDEPPSSRKHRFGEGAGAASGGPGMLNSFGARDRSGNYGKVGGDAEKSAWLKSQTGRSKRWKYVFGIIGIIVVLVIIAGVVGGVLATNPPGGSSSSSSSVDSNGPLDIHSSAVQDVLNNKDLHKIFPGMDYTPLNAQYPECLTYPPDQNNVTLDVAVLSQLTPAIRLYGTDCDQTQMVLQAINRLEMNDTIKVWLGVWLENNATTNNRQLNQMYQILETYPTSHFAGVIVGNEVLFRKDMTESQLGQVLSSVRRNLVSKGINLPVATSDLGDNWTAALAADSDIVMANVHPFFAGTTPQAAPGWTWSFWQTHDAILADATSGSYPKSIISETGWPSEGGNDCGTGAKCKTSTAGAVAGIDEMNQFMEGWVCESLANGTTYFWFEAFDEPWKVMFNDPKTGDFWEPHWGLMDVDRNLKNGVKIPDCGGRTIDKAY